MYVTIEFTFDTKVVISYYIILYIKKIIYYFFNTLIYKGLSFAEQEKQDTVPFPLAFSFSVSLQMKNAPSTTIVGFDPECLNLGVGKRKLLEFLSNQVKDNLPQSLISFFF